MRMAKTFGLFLAALLATPGQAQLAIKLTPGTNGRVNCTVTNTSQREIRFLRHETPLANEFEFGVFQLEHRGKPVPYIGKMVHRIGVGPEDWMQLSAGESVEVQVDLGQSYDMNEEGVYSVRFQRPVGIRYAPKVGKGLDPEMAMRDGEDVRDAKESLDRQLPKEQVDVDSNAAELFLESPRTPKVDTYSAAETPQAAAAAAVGAWRFSGCSSSWISSIKSDAVQGQNYAYRGYSLLYNKPVAQRASYASYLTWYGTYTSSRYATVQNGFSRIYNSFGANWTVNCNLGCQSNWAAYVYPNQTYIVQICNGYFSYQVPERSTVLLHEASHWTAILGTRDYAYFYNNCQNLARTNPSQAVYNADSYHFFSMYAK